MLEHHRYRNEAEALAARVSAALPQWTAMKEGLLW